MTMRILRLTPPAKLNLFLHITGRRPDGYHELQTIFQLIDLCDELVLEVGLGNGLELVSDYNEVAPEDNIVIKAARLLAAHVGIEPDARIELVKQIPSGGGLGGGSSDAAATLLGLNRLWRCGCGLDELAALGTKLGADVPIFVHGHSAWAEGIGEKLQSMMLADRWFVVIRPDCSVNTAAIFANEGLTRNTTEMKIAALPEDGGRNDCEAVVRKLYPPVASALDWLGRYAKGRMSGTGSCVYAAFDSEESAKRVAAEVPPQWQAYVARGMNESPVHMQLRE